MHKFTTIEEYNEYIESNYTWWDKFILNPKMNWLRWTIYNLPAVPRDTYNSIKYFIQRGLRGYSDEDVWSVSYYISSVLKKIIKDLKNQVHGYPTNFKSLEQWKNVLTEIEWTFRTAEKLDANDWVRLKKTDLNNKEIISLSKKHNIHIMTEEECRRYDKGWKLFKKYFHNLWD